jgi:hypothetical protein
VSIPSWITVTANADFFTVQGVRPTIESFTLAFDIISCGVVTHYSHVYNAEVVTCTPAVFDQPGPEQATWSVGQALVFIALESNQGAWTYNPVSIPSWVSVLVQGGSISFSGTRPDNAAVNIQYSITSCGVTTPYSITYPAIVVGCTPAAYTMADFPTTWGVGAGQGMSATNSNSGDWNYAPISMPSWITVNFTSGSFTLTGVRPSVAAFTLAFSITSCGNTATYTHDYPAEVVACTPANWGPPAASQTGWPVGASRTYFASNANTSTSWTYAAINMPSWVTVGVFAQNINISGTRPDGAAVDIQYAITTCGVTTNYSVQFPAIANCQPAIMAAPTWTAQPWNTGDQRIFFHMNTNSELFTLTPISVPLWMTIQVFSTHVYFEGTRPNSAAFTLSYTITTCGVSTNYSQNF